MSLSWLDRLTLLLHPQHLLLESQPWHGKARRLTVAVGQPGDGQSDWQPALASASSLLTTQSRRHQGLRIIVANPFCRFALLPWSESVLGDAARRALATALFRHTLGDAAEGLEITLDRAVFGQNGLAAGLPLPLLEGLRQLARSHRLRLHSLQPQLSAELAARSQILGNGPVAFPDAGWLTLIGLQDGQLCAVRNHRAAADPAQRASELQGLLDSGLAAVNPKKVQIFETARWPETLGDWQVEWHHPQWSGGAHA